MEFINKVILRGVIASEPKVTKVGDTSMVRFPLATVIAYKNHEGISLMENTFHNISAWEGDGVVSFQLLKKSGHVMLSGRIAQRKMTDENGKERHFTEIIASSLTTIEETTDEKISEGIFNNASFGQRFLTRDGRKAVFLHFWGNPVQSAFVDVEGFGEQECSLDGRIDANGENARDITQSCMDNQWAHWLPEGYKSQLMTDPATTGTSVNK